MCDLFLTDQTDTDAHSPYVWGVIGLACAFSIMTAIVVVMTLLFCVER